jgi:hypothetical protein
MRYKTTWAANERKSVVWSDASIISRHEFKFATRRVPAAVARRLDLRQHGLDESGIAPPFVGSGVCVKRDR